MARDYSNEIRYGRNGNKFFVQSLEHTELIALGDTLREAFDKYIEQYN